MLDAVKQELLYSVGMQINTTLMESSMEIPQKAKKNCHMVQ
jgi:hypothetical protein